MVVGSGVAGHAAAETQRREGFRGPIVVPCETDAPYNRTMVDNAVLRGVLTPELAALLAIGVLDLEMIRARAARLDVRHSTVGLSDGRELPSAALVIATGSTPAHDRLVRAEERTVRHLHTLADVAAVRRLLDEGSDSSIGKKGVAAGRSAL